MGDMASVGGLLASLQSISEITKGLIGLRDAAMIQGKVAELTAEIITAQQGALAAQQDQSALLQRVRDLEKQVRDFETWEAEKKRYRLTDFGGGTFAYLLKPEMGDDEPAHRLCANCFQKNQKSILQSRGRDAFGRDMYECPACDQNFSFGERQDAPVRSGYGPRRSWTDR